VRVGYLGPRGTFTELAARRLHQGDDVELIPYRTIPEVLRDAEAGRLDQGVVPIENSIEGSVALTLDVLIHEVSISITGECVLPVVHHLMAKPGTRLGDVQAVLSHPQALAQCRQSLERLVPGADQRAATSTAEAARVVSESAEPLAALGTDLAASLYGLEVLEHGLQDLQANATRFVSTGKRSSARTGRDKTSVVFAFGTDKPGNLYKALQVFAERNINLTKLESRPAKQSLGEYLFLVDMEGHTEDREIEEALAAVASQCSFFKVLGSYPRVDYPRVNGNGI